MRSVLEGSGLSEAWLTVISISHNSLSFVLALAVGIGLGGLKIHILAFLNSTRSSLLVLIGWEGICEFTNVFHFYV